MIRDLQGWDKMFYVGKIMTPIVLRFAKKSDVAPHAEMLARKVLAFQLGTDGHILYRNPQHVPIYDLPNLSNNEELSHYMLQKHTRPYKLALGSIGVNDDSIVINCNHMLADGGYLHFIIDEISQGRDTPLEDDYPHSAEFLFNKEISEAPDNLLPADYDMKLTNFISKDRDQLNSNEYAKLIITEFPAESLKCYNKEKKVIKGLTESILSNFYAATVAYNAQSYKCGVESCIDLRRFLKKKTWSDTCIFSMVPIMAKVTPSESLNEIGQKLRFDLNKRLDNGTGFSYLKAIYENKTGPEFSGSRCEISNVGPTRIGGPLVDAYYGYSELSIAMPHIISITSFSIIGNGRNNIIFRLKFNTDQLSTREARMMSASTIFAMQNIDKETSLEKAIEEISKFQKKYLKENKGTVQRYVHAPEMI